MKSTLAGLFGRSPFRAIQQHMDLVAKCSLELGPLLAAAEEGQSEALEAVRVRVDTLEHEADTAKHEIRTSLPRTMMMPVDRRDLLEILHTQDSIADTVQDVAGLLCLHPVPSPEAFGDRLRIFGETVVETVEKCHEIIGLLDELLELGFRGREADRVEVLIGELSDLESKTDDQGMELAGVLFGQHANLDMATFVLWHELLRRIGDVADYAERVGNQLRLLLAR